MFDLIEESVQSANDLIKEIAENSREQRINITEINKGLNAVNEVVLRNSSVSEQTATSSREPEVTGIHVLSSIRARFPQDTRVPGARGDGRPCSRAKRRRRRRGPRQWRASASCTRRRTEQTALHAGGARTVIATPRKVDGAMADRLLELRVELRGR